MTERHLNFAFKGVLHFSTSVLTNIEKWNLKSNTKDLQAIYFYQDLLGKHSKLGISIKRVQNCFKLQLLPQHYEKVFF